MNNRIYTRRNFVRMGTMAAATAALGLVGCAAEPSGQSASSGESSTSSSQLQHSSAPESSSSSLMGSTTPSSDASLQGQDASSSNEASQASFPIADKHLSSGFTMPAFGLGTWTLSVEEAENSSYCALENGYRLIDTAQYYGNKEGVGNAVRRAIADGLCAREDVFVTSKIMPSSYERAAESIDESLARLNIDYIDLMLIHQPGSNDEAVRQALEEAVRAEKIRSIGISNYYTPDRYESIAHIAEIPVALVQNENHPFYQNIELQTYVEGTGSYVESWYPLGGRPGVAQMLANETLGAIAAAHGKTVAQTVLRWHVQSGYIAIPGSGNPDHIAENIQIFDFELTEDDMAQIAALHGVGRFENW